MTRTGAGILQCLKLEGQTLFGIFGIIFFLIKADKAKTNHSSVFGTLECIAFTSGCSRNMKLLQAAATTAV